VRAFPSSPRWRRLLLLSPLPTSSRCAGFTVLLVASCPTYLSCLCLLCSPCLCCVQNYALSWRLGFFLPVSLSGLPKATFLIFFVFSPSLTTAVCAFFSLSLFAFFPLPLFVLSNPSSCHARVFSVTDLRVSPFCLLLISFCLVQPLVLSFCD
jgi:hypothetical protein